MKNTLRDYQKVIFWIGWFFGLITLAVVEVIYKFVSLKFS